MTSKHTIPDSNGNPIKDPTWFSWRHRTREAHDAARERYLSLHGPAARKRRAAEREAAGREAARKARAGESR